MKRQLAWMKAARNQTFDTYEGFDPGKGSTGLPKRPDGPCNIPGALIDPAKVGRPGRCKGCGKKIYWMENSRGRWFPANSDGTNHFSTCPQADKFRR